MAEGEGVFASSLYVDPRDRMRHFSCRFAQPAPVGCEPIDFGNKVRYSVCRSETISYLKPLCMKKSVEVAILIGLCLLSLILGLVMGKGAQNIGVALFFYLLSAFFFLAIFRPRTL
jgi:hypothetical protein